MTKEIEVDDEDESPFNYDKHCIVGIGEFEIEKEYDLDAKYCSSTVAIRIGNEKCVCEFNADDESNNKIRLSLKRNKFESGSGSNVGGRKDDDGYADVMIMTHSRGGNELRKFRPYLMDRVMLSDSRFGVRFAWGCFWNNTRITVRLLAERPQLINPLPDTGTIEVGQMKFKVNREFLSSCSPVFNAMFNSDSFVEKSSKEVVLKEMNPEAFSDFLLLLYNSKLLDNDVCVLPDTQNIEAILELADFFDVKYLKHECTEFLKTAHDIPASERFDLIKKYRLKQTMASLFEDMDETEYQDQLFKMVIDSSSPSHPSAPSAAVAASSSSKSSSDQGRAAKRTKKLHPTNVDE